MNIFSKKGFEGVQIFRNAQFLTAFHHTELFQIPICRQSFSKIVLKKLNFREIRNFEESKFSINSKTGMIFDSPKILLIVTS